MDKNNLKKALAGIALLSLASTLPAFSQADAQPTPHEVRAAKLMVDDLAKTQAFYEQMFGMKELNRYSTDSYEETILGFAGDGARIALFAPNHEAEAPLPKSQFPVVLVDTPELDAVVGRAEKAGHPIRRLPSGENGFNIAIATDPSGNAVEIFSRPGEYAVGGSKLIVDDRAKAEAFYAKIFGATPGQRFSADGVYDEVLMQFGKGPFLALFQPLAEKPLTKSRYPVTAIYTTDFDGVLERIEAEGLGYRELPSRDDVLHVIIAKDPAGNAIEIIRR